MKNTLAELLECADREGHQALSQSDMESFGLQDTVLPFMAFATAPETITCPGCHQACPKPISKQNSKAFIWCDEAPALGYIELQPKDLRYQKIDIEKLSQALSQTLGFSAIQEIVPGRVYDLGAIENRTLFLVRGIAWDDTEALCSDSRIHNNSPLLITLSKAPDGMALPILWIGQLLMLNEQGNITADMTRLHIALGVKTQGNASSFHQRGKHWYIHYEGKEVTISDSKGMAYIQHLLLHPNKEVAAIELQGLRNKIAATDNALIGQDLLPLNAKDEILDKQAIQEITKRISQLDHDSPERLKLQAYLKSSTHGGKSKAFKNANEKARQAVTAAVNRAINAIDKHHTSLATHLRNNLQQGTIFYYKPEKMMQWQ